jgi:hypothetical protein
MVRVSHFISAQRATSNAVATMNKDIDAIVKRDYDPQSKTDETILFEGFRVNTVKQIVYWLLVICTLGFFWLLARWIPSLYVAFNLDRVPLYKATRICAKVSFLLPFKANFKQIAHHFLLRDCTPKSVKLSWKTLILSLREQTRQNILFSDSKHGVGTMTWKNFHIALDIDQLYTHSINQSQNYSEPQMKKNARYTSKRYH